ncbi:MAG: MATE family efflux transporter [Dehalococcoidales bacterium]|nr:MATE family efflux transporter [Dehalococcoidales bacterium]
MQKNPPLSLTEGNIFRALLKFALPVLLALLLQALYGGVDLLIVGRFADTADVSGVATGSIVLQTITNLIAGLAMGVTILVGRLIGEKKRDEAGKAIGAGISLFAIISLILTAAMVFGANFIAHLMQSPQEAFAQTAAYIRICGIGSVFIVAYNLLGSIFRGIGDAKTPLLAVAIACLVNIVGDLLLVGAFHMGAAGAAIATVFAQGVSVWLSVSIVKKRELPFGFSRDYIRLRGGFIREELRLGTPLALQDFLLGLSFVVIQMIVNAINVVSSAGVGVAEKLCMFIMLVPVAYMQAMSAFVAQNIGAGKPERAKKALGYGILSSLIVGLLMAYAAFFHGDALSALFTDDTLVVAASHDYLKAYAIDCLMAPFIFCFIGFYNGYGKTFFVMVQGIIGSVLIRIPLAYIISRISGATLFHIGLSIPISTFVQVLLCVGLFLLIQKRNDAIHL